MWDFNNLEEEDTWSLMAVVNECARRVKLRGVVVDDDGGGDSGGGSQNTTNQTTAVVDVDNNNPNSFPNQFDATSNINSFQNYPLFSADQFDACFSKCSNSLENPLFSSQIESTTYTNSVENQTLFSHQFDVKYSNSFQNSLFSSQTDSTTYTNLVENTPLFSSSYLQNPLITDQIDSTTYTNSDKNYPSLLFPREFDTKTNYSIENSLLFSGQTDGTTHTNSVENPQLPNQLDTENSTSIKNPILPDKIDGTTHTNSEQYPPLPNEPDTKNITSPVKSPASLFPEKFGAHTRNSSGCDHHFQNLYKHFTVPTSIKPQSGPAAIAPLQDFIEVKDESADDPVPTGALQQSQQLQPPVNFLFIPKHTSQSTNDSPVSVDFDDNSPRRRRKFENRSVYRVNVDDLAKNDKWAWRKYGQKPIKGSPYPRNYYKCSSIKGCTARKQVERSPTDSETYVVTYTGHHHHPCPTFRNNGGHRLKGVRSNVDLAPGAVSPTSIMETHHLNVGLSRSGSGENVVILDDDEDLGIVGVGAGAGDDKIVNSNTIDINNVDGYESGYEFRYEISKCNADADTSVQEKDTNVDYDNWDSEMIKTQFLF